MNTFTPVYVADDYCWVVLLKPEHLFSPIVAECGSFKEAESISIEMNARMADEAAL